MLVIIFICTLVPSQIKAETLKIFPTDDSMAILYDDDGITDWVTARNFDGLVSREPIKSGTQNNEGMIVVRSDNGTGKYRIYRVSMVFGPVSLPVEAKITKATLNLYKTYGNSQGDISVVITSHQREITEVMQKQDWNITSFGTLAFARNNFSDNQYSEFTFGQNGLDYIKANINSSTTLGILTEFDFDDIEPQGYILSAGWYEIEKEGNDFDPYLEIEYTIPDTEDEYPLYTQIESPYPSLAETAGWADDTYASGDAYCGGTIAKCGCAITSLVMMARANGITKGVDDSDVNPGNFNSWLIDNKGYTHGAVNWTTALQYFGTENEDETINVPIKLSKHNQSSTTLIKASASSEGEYVVGFSTKVPGGHYFVISDYIEDDYIVRDPWYYNTKTLDDVVSSTSVKVKDYDNVINKANIFSLNDPKVLTGVIEIALASPAELRLEDRDEKITGYDSGGVVADIPSSSYDQNESIGDPDDPEAGLNTHYVKRLMVLEASEKYGLEVVGLDTGPYTLGVTVFDIAGQHHYFEYKGVTYEGKVDRFVIDVETGEIRPKGNNEDDENDDDDEEDDDDDRDHGDKDKRHHKLLKKWLGKIERELQKGKYRQAKVHVKTFHKLLKAKKVDGDYWRSALHEILSDYEIEKKGKRHEERGKSGRDD